ncbi:hypothetical protein WMY93_033225 [Mugilogobius chulae]|uniref:Uncharacterized protein n=1 Tax=Mugilogobius chulae TaxID=88201 RepID=A0AAW0MHI6_9GOBI
MARTPPHEDPRDPLLCARAGGFNPGQSALSGPHRTHGVRSLRLGSVCGAPLSAQPVAGPELSPDRERSTVLHRAVEEKTRRESVSRAFAIRTRTTQEHARKPTAVCTRISLSARRAKVVFVCERNVGRTRSACDTSEIESSWLWVRGACVSVTSQLSHFLMDNLRVLFRSGTGPEREDTSQTETQFQPPAAAADSCPADGAVCGARITEDRPD